MTISSTTQTLPSVGAKTFCLNLTRAGMRMHKAKVLDTNLATKADIMLIRKDMEILRKQMPVTKRDIIIWIGSALIAVTTIIINFMPVATP